MKHSRSLSIHSDDKVFLESDFVFIYHQTDGFCRRLLQADLLVGKDFVYELQMKSFETQESTGAAFEQEIKGHLPIRLRENLNYLLALKDPAKKLDHSYGKYMTDIGSRDFKLKIRNKVFNTSVHVLGADDIESQNNPAKAAFLSLYEDLYEWIEALYAALK